MWGQPGDRDRRDRERQQERDDRDDRIAQAVSMLAAVAVLAVLWPILAVMAVTVAAAWATGMHHARILRAALWSLSMTGTFVIAATVQDRPWAPGRLRQWAGQPCAR